MIIFINSAHIKNKRVLLRVDFNVSLTDKLKIADDQRIRQSLPTIQYLLRHDNKIILMAHLGRPDGRDKKFSLKNVAKHLDELLPSVDVTLVDDFLSKEGRGIIEKQKKEEIILLENIRFYKGESENELKFAGQLATLADVYVNDAFGVSHRKSASIVGVPNFLPSYGGLLLEREIETISHLLKHPRKPFVAIIGGAKISTKIKFLMKLIEVADSLILGGAIANTFLVAKGFNVGKSLIEKDMVDEAKRIIRHAKEKQTEIIIPEDVVVGDRDNDLEGGVIKKVEDIGTQDEILDMGPETLAHFAKLILLAKTIVWNGPVGYIENPQYAMGTDFLYYTIAQNQEAMSVVGGGDTLVSISKKEYLDKISHISTGGGAMLEFIENGTLPGIEALKTK